MAIKDEEYDKPVIYIKIQISPVPLFDFHILSFYCLIKLIYKYLKYKTRKWDDNNKIYRFLALIMKGGVMWSDLHFDVSDSCVGSGLRKAMKGHWGDTGQKTSAFGQGGISNIILTLTRL